MVDRDVIIPICFVEIANVDISFYGCATIEEYQGRSIWGCLYLLDDLALERFDRIEQYPWMYTRKEFNIKSASTSRFFNIDIPDKCMAYTMTQTAKGPGQFPPPSTYVDIIRSGVRKYCPEKDKYLEQITKSVRRAETVGHNLDTAKAYTDFFD